MNRKPGIVIDGMYGIGDNLHQRALLRELMKTHTVWLRSCHYTLYHDLVAQGLKVVNKGTRLRAQARTLQQELRLFWPTDPPHRLPVVKVWYNKPDIDKHGSILESILGELGYRVENPDFSLPLKPEWEAEAAKILERLKPKRTNKPTLILRQLVLRREWDGAKRNPDPAIFGAIYQSIRDQHWVLSIADLEQGLEWIEGPTLETDAQIHDGSLTFGAMAGLYAQADLVLSPAGHGPILAQAVGTPSIVVYGGRESFRTTERAGQHLAPTLGIDPDHPCDCHSNSHNCDKRTSLEPALARVKAFLMQLERRNQPEPPKTLIFATTYVDSGDRQALTAHWLKLHSTLNPHTDLLLVDSQSPLPLLPEDQLATFTQYVPGQPFKRAIHTFPENIGHLSRGGRDGWGRAFSFGLDAAIDGNYDYVAHIEGDLLFRLPLEPIIEEMERLGHKAASTVVKGMTRDPIGWCETALMIFKTSLLVETNFTERYNWKARRVAPAPEQICRTNLGKDLWLAPWKVLRGDKNQITHQNVLSLNLDGVTHCHTDSWTYDVFAAEALRQHEERLKAPKPPPRQPEPPPPSRIPPPQYPAPLKLNLGCGDNKLAGWENHDADVDIRKTLPWDDDSVDLLFIEHCMEHVTYHQAVQFLEEVHRILKPGGVLRVTVPSIEQVIQCEDGAYHKFTAQWGGETSRRGAARALIFSHGHLQAWTASLMRATLTYAGFINLSEQTPGQSGNPLLRNLEGHGKIIGERFNRIESMPFEATKPGQASSAGQGQLRAAIVLGGAECHEADLAHARKLLAEVGLEPTIIMVNDQIEHHPGPGIAVTLHPRSLETWLTERKKKGHQPPAQIWAHRRDSPHVTNVTQDWAGSSGLLGTKVALLELNYDRIILCGVPMTMEGRHFRRHAEWGASMPFRRGWEHNLHHLTERVRSCSGWTEKLLGAPTAEWAGGIPTTHKLRA